MADADSLQMNERDFERQLLRDVAADFVSEKAGTAFTRKMAASESGVDEDIWRQMAEMAWHGILVPEAYDGMGLGLAEMSIVLQELGRSAYQGPFFATAVASVLSLRQCDNEECKKPLLQGIADGSLVATLALEEGYKPKWNQFKCTAAADGQAYRLNGCKMFVPYAHVADKLIVAAQCGKGVGLFSVDRDLAGVRVGRLSTMSGAKLCRVRFDDVRLPGACLLNSPDTFSILLETVFHQCALLKCAEMIGGAEAALKMAVEHVSLRKQFGVPVGTFQAVQHRCADMFTLVDSGSILLTESIDAILQDEQRLGELAAICKIWVSDAYRSTVKGAHQLMAGTGYMEETDLQLYFRHAKISELAFGTPDFYRTFLADCLEIPLET